MKLVKIVVPVLILVGGWFVGPQIDNLIGLSHTVQTPEWAPVVHNIAFAIYAIAIWESIKWALWK